MLFMYVHTHSLETCLVGEPELAKAMTDRMKEEAQNAGVKLVGPYMASQEHTVFAVLEGDDYDGIQRVVAPMAALGAAHLIAVSPVA
jgi:uncharacterized protein with GYD domain